MHKPYVVLVILEAAVGKEEELRRLLIGVVEPSRKEKTCLEYRLHQTLDKPNEFILYEHWENKLAHEAQFKKCYIQELGEKLESLLAKPYQVFFAEEISLLNKG